MDWEEQSAICKDRNVRKEKTPSDYVGVRNISHCLALVSVFLAKCLNVQQFDTKDLLDELLTESKRSTYEYISLKSINSSIHGWMDLLIHIKMNLLIRY